MKLGEGFSVACPFYVILIYTYLCNLTRGGIRSLPMAVALFPPKNETNKQTNKGHVKTAVPASNSR